MVTESQAKPFSAHTGTGCAFFVAIFLWDELDLFAFCPLWRRLLSVLFDLANEGAKQSSSQKNILLFNNSFGTPLIRRHV